MFGKGGIGNLMKQAQAMQANMEKAQAEIAAMEVEGQAGSGAVKVLMTGKHMLKRVQIDDAAMDDKETLEDLLVLAFNDAATKLEQASAAKMAPLSAGLPAGMKLPF